MAAAGAAAGLAGARRATRAALLLLVMLVLSIAQQAGAFLPSQPLPLQVRSGRSRSRVYSSSSSSGGGGGSSPPPGGKDFYSADAAMEALEEAQERYAQARARREKFLMEAQRNFQKMAERHEAEMEALVTQEKEVADLLEARAAEVKQVKDEVSVLVQEADEIMGGAKGLLVGFDVVTALSAMVVLDTFYISYLTYRGSGGGELLGTSLATELILGGALFIKIKERERAQAEKAARDEQDKKGGGGRGGGGNGGGSGKTTGSAPSLVKPDVSLPSGGLWQ